MRKDVILGMSIGGVMLAVVIVYLTVAPGHKANHHLVDTGGQVAEGPSGAGDVGSQGAGESLEVTPVTPAPKSDTAKGADPKSDANKKPAPAAPHDAKLVSQDKPVVGSVQKQPGAEKKPQSDEPAGGSAKAHDAKLVSNDKPERADPVWGDRLWGRQTPLIGVTQTPDPNAAAAENVDRAVLGGEQQQSEGAGDQGSAPTTLAGQPKGPEVASAAGNDNRLVQIAPPKTGGEAKGGEQVRPTVAPPLSEAPAKPHTHKVQKGETFSTIAAAAYGSANYYPYIMRANPTVDAKSLKPNMVINLPDVSEVKPPEKPATAKVGETATPGAHHAEAAAIDPTKEYKVGSGDSLHKIAVKLYGKVEYVEKIYELNKQAIGDNPAKLKLGMVLKLPAPPTATATTAGTH